LWGQARVVFLLSAMMAHSCSPNAEQAIRQEQEAEMAIFRPNLQNETFR
jgi:hypothetical protein